MKISKSILIIININYLELLEKSKDMNTPFLAKVEYLSEMYQSRYIMSFFGYTWMDKKGFIKTEEV